MTLFDGALSEGIGDVPVACFRKRQWKRSRVIEVQSKGARGI
jgi:hypothetical protein